MRVNLGLAAHNSDDWERVKIGNYVEPAAVPDSDCIKEMLAMGDKVEDLGFDGIWVTDHCATPFSMTPNPLQLLTYFAARTTSISLGTMVAVAPWWNPVRLAHQIAYLDILSNGRYNTIGLGRGVSKTEFDAVGVPREQARTRYAETLDILELAFTRERFSYEGDIYKLPEMSIRPQPLSRDLYSRLYSGSSSAESLEINARRGLKPLFIGNKPLSEAAKQVRQVNLFRQEMGFEPCQPRNVMFMYCAPTKEAASEAQKYVAKANHDVTYHYGYNDPDNFAGVKGYEAYAAQQASATAVNAAAVSKEKGSGGIGYDESNLLIATPEIITQRIIDAQNACSFSELTLWPQFGDMPWDVAGESLQLFAKEVLPAIHNLDAQLHPAALPEPQARPA